MIAPLRGRAEGWADPWLAPGGAPVEVTLIEEAGDTIMTLRHIAADDGRLT